MTAPPMYNGAPAAPPPPGSHLVQDLEKQVWMTTQKLNLVTESLEDIRTTIKRIEKMVGIIRVVEMGSKQLEKDTQSLARLVSELTSRVSETEKLLHEDIESVEVKSADATKKVSEALSTFEKSWTARWNFARGVWAVITAVGLVVCSGIMLFLNAQNAKIDASHNWIEREKIERSYRSRLGSGSVATGSPPDSASKSNTNP